MPLHAISQLKPHTQGPILGLELTCSGQFWLCPNIGGKKEGYCVETLHLKADSNRSRPCKYLVQPLPQYAPTLPTEHAPQNKLATPTDDVTPK